MRWTFHVRASPRACTLCDCPPSSASRPPLTARAPHRVPCLYPAYDPRQITTAFNQPLSWDTSSVTTLAGMFTVRCPPLAPAPPPTHARRARPRRLPAARSPPRAPCALFATLGRTRTSSTSRSAGTPPASRTCTNCLRCAPSHMPRALKSPQSRAFCPRGTAHTTRRAASRLRGPRTARTAPCVHCLRPSAERVQVQPAAQLGHLPRHGHGVDVWRALLPAPCPPISAVAPSPLHTHAVRAHTALARCLPPPAARAARPAPCALCASDRFGRERTSSTSL